LGRFSDDIRGAIPGLTQGGPTGYALPIPWAGLSIIAEKIARGCEYRLKDKEVRLAALRGSDLRSQSRRDQPSLPVAPQRDRFRPRMPGWRALWKTRMSSVIGFWSGARCAFMCS